jgi:hypothetical protein
VKKKKIGERNKRRALGLPSEDGDSEEGSVGPGSGPQSALGTVRSPGQTTRRSGRGSARDSARTGASGTGRTVSATDRGASPSPGPSGTTGQGRRTTARSRLGDTSRTGGGLPSGAEDGHDSDASSGSSYTTFSFTSGSSYSYYSDEEEQLEEEVLEEGSVDDGAGPAGAGAGAGAGADAGTGAGVIGALRGTGRDTGRGTGRDTGSGKDGVDSRLLVTGSSRSQAASTPGTSSPVPGSSGLASLSGETSTRGSLRIGAAAAGSPASGRSLASRKDASLHHRSSRRVVERDVEVEML